LRNIQSFATRLFILLRRVSPSYLSVMYISATFEKLVMTNLLNKS